MYSELATVFFQNSRGMDIPATTVTCDACGSSGPVGRDISDTQSKAYKAGWGVVRGPSYDDACNVQCPTCLKKKVGYVSFRRQVAALPPSCTNG